MRRDQIITAELAKKIRRLAKDEGQTEREFITLLVEELEDERRFRAELEAHMARLEDQSAWPNKPPSGITCCSDVQLIEDGDWRVYRCERHDHQFNAHYVTIKPDDAEPEATSDSPVYNPTS